MRMSNQLQGIVGQQEAPAAPPSTPASVFAWDVSTLRSTIEFTFPTPTPAGLTVVIFGGTSSTAMTPPSDFTLIDELVAYCSVHAWVGDDLTNGTEGGTTISVTPASVNPNVFYMVLIDGTYSTHSGIPGREDPVPSMTAPGPGLGLWFSTVKDAASPLFDVFPPVGSGITKIDSEIGQLNMQRTGWGTKTVPAGPTGTQQWTKDGDGSQRSMGLLFLDPV